MRYLTIYNEEENMTKLKSMTGFGRVATSNDTYSIIVEIRSVNGKILDIKWRLPSLIRHFESQLEKMVRQYASRGRVEISINLQYIDKTAELCFDQAKAKAMLEIITAFSKTESHTFNPDLNKLLSIQGLWNANEEEVGEDLQAFVQETLKSALMDWDKSKQEEAKELYYDLQARFSNLQMWAKQIEQNAPQIKEQRFINVRERLQELLQNLESSLDENRFLQEMVILSDKLDVSEEIIRLHSHFNRLKSLLDSGEEAGRKLDFTLQECFREINTCGNKIQDAQMSILVVEFKNELEKCREQVQNLE